MADFKWSDEQKQAITYTSGNCLISAGAGSGKTAVLTERIYQLVKNGADISRFLVLTFSNAAAAEMKYRIRKRILEDPELSHLSSRVETAHIETFDAFALFIVKKYASNLGISPNVVNLDGTIIKIKKREYVDEYLTYLYSNKDSAFYSFIRKYCVKDDSRIRDFVLKVSDYVESKQDKYGCLDTLANEYFQEEKIDDLLMNVYKEQVSAINDAIIQADNLDNVDDSKSIIEYLDNLLNNSHDYDSLFDQISSSSFPSQKGKYADEEKKEERKAIKNDVLISLGINDKNKGFGPSSYIKETFLSTKEDARILVDIVKHLEQKLDQFKKEKNAYSFSDIQFMALSLLDNNLIKEEMSQYFEYILVDEYQDTSPIQEAVINKIERNNVCMVGDIKQSIYKFRGADCTIFQKRFDKYINNDGGTLINLNASYRSREEICDVVNDCFSSLMKKEFNPIDYQQGHKFKYALKIYDDLKDANINYGLNVIQYDESESEKNWESEAHIVVNDILNHIKNKNLIFDKDTNTLRACSYKDFAIIASEGTHFDTFKKVFSQRGVPIKIMYKDSFFNNDIIVVTKNVLVIINEILNDNTDSNEFKHAMVSILRSYLYEMKDQEIYNLVTNNSLKDCEFYNSILKRKSYFETAPLASIVKTIIDDYAIDKKSSKLQKYTNNLDRINMFIDIASSMDELGFSLDELIDYFNKLKDNNLDLEYEDYDVANDSVTLMTIHKSKGLEWPILYMPLLTSNFTKDSGSSFSVTDKYGIIFPISGTAEYSSIFIHLIKQETILSDFEERLRLLYVGMTRAREQLIMIDKKSKSDKIVLNPTKASTFSSILKYLKNLPISTPCENVIFAPDNSQNNSIESRNITLDSIKVKESVETIKRASKELDIDVDEKLLEFGNEIHYLLENVNFETKDLSMIKDFRKRKYINNVISQDLFKNVKNSQVLHEFPFKDEQNHTNGIIDCLLLKDDEVDIIDFKLKHLDDDKYVLQLHTYCDYIKQITDLPIKMYLIGAITGEVKEIE